MNNSYIEQAHQLRSDPLVHYNCAQAVTIPFAKGCGLSEEQAAALATHFGGGMKMGSVCGAITGGAMVLGLLGASDEQYRAFLQAMRAQHDDVVTCAELLQKNAEMGGNRKTHCNGMIDEAIEAIIDVMGL